MGTAAAAAAAAASGPVVTGAILGLPFCNMWALRER